MAVTPIPPNESSLNYLISSLVLFKAPLHNYTQLRFKGSLKLSFKLS